MADTAAALIISPFTISCAVYELALRRLRAMMPVLEHVFQPGRLDGPAADDSPVDDPADGPFPPAPLIHLSSTHTVGP